MSPESSCCAQLGMDLIQCSRRKNHHYHQLQPAISQFHYVGALRGYGGWAPPVSDGSCAARQAALDRPSAVSADRSENERQATVNFNESGSGAQLWTFVSSALPPAMRPFRASQERCKRPTRHRIFPFYSPPQKGVGRTPVILVNTLRNGCAYANY